jgi:membrane protease subunit HflK
VTRDRLYYDMMQSVLTNSSKVLIDQKAGGNLLYLPLDKLIQGGGAAAATDSPAAPRPVVPAPAEAGVSVDPGHSRDALRNRER